MASWFARRGWLLPAIAALLALLVVGLQAGFSHEPGPASRHVTQVQWQTRAGGSFGAMPPPDAAPVDGRWQPVTLPHAWSPTVMTRGSVRRHETHWLRFELKDLPAAAEGVVLYLPRWQTVGRIAVYADDRLLFRSAGDPAWAAFNIPLWVPLDANGTLPRPAVVQLRIDSLANAGGSLSSAWVGPAADLAPLHDLRQLLQNSLMDHLSMGALALSAFAFVLWLLDRRERLFLLFSVFAVVWVLRGLRFHVGADPLPIPSAWFGWLINNSANALLVTWFLFVATLVPAAPRWLGRVLLTLLILSTIITLPWLAAVPHIELTAPLSYAVTIAAGVPTLIYMAWLAWRPGAGAGVEGRIATAIGLVHVPVALHDWMLQSHQLSAEAYYWWPISTSARLLLFAGIVLRRYVTAVQGVERANRELTLQLAEREQALNATHEALREADQRDTLMRERERLMQDIHDGMGSQLVGALKLAEAGGLREEQMASVLRECLDDLKLTVDSLDPVDADLVLLLATWRYRLEPRIEAAGLRVRWEVQDVPPLPWLQPQAALHVLRILQEAAANVVRHAGATELRVATACRDEGVLVTIEDDGTAAAVLPEAAPKPEGRGLPNMRRRAQAIGGRLTWKAEPGGSRLELWLPLVAPA